MSNTRRIDANTGRMPVKSRNDQPRKAKTDVRAISKISIGQIVGLLEAIEEAGGEADAAVIGREVDMDLDDLQPVVDAAEFLGLLIVHGGELRINDLSRRILGANARQRKALLKTVISGLPIFREVMHMAGRLDRPLHKDEILDTLAARFGAHQSPDLFRALVYWGRYAELVKYDRGSEEFSLRELSKP